MLSKVCVGLLIGASGIYASLSTEANTSVVGVGVRGATTRWDIVFPGIQPAQIPGQAWVSDNFVQQIEAGINNPNWDGAITFHGDNLHSLNVAQLQQLVERIQVGFGCPGRIQFSAPVQEHNTQVVRLLSVAMTAEIPFVNWGLMLQISGLDFYELIDRGVPRNTVVANGLSFGKAWRVLGAFIKHSARGINEVAILSQNVQTDVATRLLITRGVAIMDKMATVWNQVNDEFEKVPEARDPAIVAHAKDLTPLLGDAIKFGGVGNDEDPSAEELREFIHNQPAPAQLRAIAACKNFGNAEVKNDSETTGQMLDRLLTEKPRNDIAAAVENGGEGLAMTTRLDGRLWNLFKITDPQADQFKQNFQQRNYQHGYYQGNDWQFNQQVVTPIEAQITNVAKNLHLRDGTYALLVRTSAMDRHVFRVVRFRVQQDQWNPQNMRSILVSYLGLVEISAAKPGDRASYDPMREHRTNSIRGTRMEQRVHAAMIEQRVHQFTDLSEYHQDGLRREIEAYNHDRYKTGLENQRLQQFALTPEEASVPENATAEEIKALQKSKAAKVSGELKERLVGARAIHLRKHGGDLRINPAQRLHMRVHELFSPDRVHVTQSLSQRERQFLGANREGGYLDTVENAIAKQQFQNPIEPPAREQDPRIHRYAVSTGVGQSGLNAPQSSYNNIADALADYDE